MKLCHKLLMMVKSCNITEFFFNSPIGKIKGTACPKGLHYLSQNEDVFCPKESEIVQLLKTNFDNEETENHAVNCETWLRTYFHDVSSVASLAFPPICVANEEGSFRERVWLTLAKKVGVGETVSYGALASLVNKPGAAQAVGTAMATNPVAIIVPCHRVIRSDGSMGLYAKGKKNDVKAWLLKHEGVIL